MKSIKSLINALDKLKGQPNKDYLERVFVTLIEYAKDHFAHEERIMERMQYPRLAEHKKQHQIFFDMVTRFKTEYQMEDAHTTELLNRILEFLRNWLTKHILVEDKAYERYLVS